MSKNCGNKISNTCGNKVKAACTEYETDLPDFSEIGTCPSLEDTTTELYTFIGEIKNQIDLSALGELCLEYTLEEGKVIVKNVLVKFEQTICDLQNRIEELETESICNKSIAECTDVIGCLVDPCGENILTLGDWMKVVTEKICITNG
jgi:hypothetical protein|nr:MAG TPA: hypothetical protein [Caudoviricetes sp.]